MSARIKQLAGRRLHLHPQLLLAFTVKHPIAVLLGCFLDLRPPVADHYPGLCALTAAGGTFDVNMNCPDPRMEASFVPFLNKVTPKSLQAQQEKEHIHNISQRWGSLKL